MEIKIPSTLVACFTDYNRIARVTLYFGDALVKEWDVTSEEAEQITKYQYDGGEQYMIEEIDEFVAKKLAILFNTDINDLVAQEVQKWFVNLGGKK